jgi:hypothetical protein
VSRRRLQVLRWTLTALALGCVLAISEFAPRGGEGLLLFFLTLLTGIPAVMLSLHLNPPKFFKYLERPDR